MKNKSSTFRQTKLPREEWKTSRLLSVKQNWPGNNEKQVVYFPSNKTGPGIMKNKSFTFRQTKLPRE